MFRSIVFKSILVLTCAHRKKTRLEYAGLTGGLKEPSNENKKNTNVKIITVIGVSLKKTVNKNSQENFPPDIQLVLLK